MKKVVYWMSALSILGMAACTVDAGVSAAAGDPGTCDDVSCGAALASGLSAQGQAICSGAADSAYQDLLNCGCADNTCGSVCGDNLCADLGETSACGECLNQLCGPEHDTCANN